MPESYRPHLRKDDEEDRTASQSVSTNLANINTATVRDLLEYRNRTLYPIRPQQTLHEAVEIMSEHRIGALVVTDANGGVLGILSERDVVRKLAETPGKTLPHKVEQVMTCDVQTCTADDAVVSVLKRMIDGEFRHMPVVDGDAVVGIVTILDAVQFRLNLVEHEALKIKQLIVG